MNADVIADRAAEQFVKIHQPPCHQRASVLRRNDHEVSIGFTGCGADCSADVVAEAGHWFELHAETTSALNGGVENLISAGASSSGWCGFLPNNMNSSQRSPWDFADQLAGGARREPRCGC